MTPVTITAQTGPDSAGPTRPAPAWRGASALLPSRDETIDVLALLALTVIGVVGFRTAYGGHSYLAAGAAGAVLGVVLSHVCQRLRLPLLAAAAAAILAFLLFGGLISQAGAPTLPTLPTLHAIVGAAVSGWEQLLTTARPVGRSAGLLVLPYLLGLFSGVAGHALARRTSAVLLPAAAPAVVVALSILFGAAEPTAAVLQGACFAALALAWAAARQQRGTSQRTTVGRQRPWQRLGAGAAVLAVAGAGAVVVGPRLPGASDHRRVVLYVAPPSDVTVLPSPLAGFRDYTKAVPASVSLFSKELFSVSGPPYPSLVRIAAMDSYDGLSWNVANAQASGSSFAGFQRVGAVLPGAIAGPARTVTITIDPAYNQPWLPDLADATGFAFPPGQAGGVGAAAQAGLRFNVATSTGVVTSEPLAGLRYTVTAADVPAPTTTQLANATPYGEPSVSIPWSFVPSFAQTHSAGASTPMGKVLALARYLKVNGRYSDGGGAQGYVLPGASAGRLTSFLESKQIVGDGEQYAAVMALLANAVGVPARVSLDATVESNGGVYGRDVRADVELDLAQYGWVTLPAAMFTGSQRPTLQQRSVTPPAAPVKVVPPRRDDAAPVAAANQSSAVSRSAPGRTGHGFAIPAVVLLLMRDAGIPLLSVAGLAAALIAAKALRRRRRRGASPPAARVAGAWRELLDLGRDLGIEPAPHATRREQAAQAEHGGLPSAGSVALAADAAIFGPQDPDGAAAAQVWGLVDQARRGATAALPRGRRAWVAVNPASLWASRAALAGLRNMRNVRPPGPPPRGSRPSGRTLGRRRLRGLAGGGRK